MGLWAKSGIGAGVQYWESEMVGSGKIRVLIVEGEGLMGEGLRALFDSQPDLETIEESRRGRETSGWIGGLTPDVVVVNIITPGASSIGAVRQRCQECPEAKVIALSALSNQFFLGEVLRAGVRGYVALQSPFEELLEAVPARPRPC
jgi:DNA-binding NarL/FixJ family response regulator